MVEVGPISSQLRSNSGQIWPSPGRSGSNLAEFGPSLAEFGPTLAKLRPDLVESLPGLVDSGQILVDVGRTWPTSGQLPWNSARVVPIWASIGLPSENLRGHRSGTPIQQRRILQQFPRLSDRRPRARASMGDASVHAPRPLASCCTSRARRTPRASALLCVARRHRRAEARFCCGGNANLVIDIYFCVSEPNVQQQHEVHPMGCPGRLRTI